MSISAVMEAVETPHRRQAALLARQLPVPLLLGVLTAWFATSNVLLWLFLGTYNPLVLLGGCTAVGVLTLAVARMPSTVPSGGPTVGTFLIALAIALTLLVLSGEGRFFYANPDWQVRNAVLADMGRNAWPFVFDAHGEAFLLRAPLGIYFVPALVWHMAGERAASLAMLVQNAVLVATMLTASAPLFARGRARIVALAVFVGFSGLDALGALLAPHVMFDHIEHWAGSMQYSSTITLLFWVPHHAMAGWLGTACYLLWRKGMVPARMLLIVTPLSALWSPLALIGLMPFAIHAGVMVLARRELCLWDVIFPAVAVALVLLTLSYLGSDPDLVGFRLYDMPPKIWFIFEAIEILPFLLPLLLIARRTRTADPALLIAGFVLLTLPWFQVGASSDLMMRASIPALAILSTLVTERVLSDDGDFRIWLIAALVVGSITGLLELRRAFLHDAAPPVECTMFDAWDVGTVASGEKETPKGTYLARVAKVPALVRPIGATVVPSRSGHQCWTRWDRPNAR
jgi:hypothetical protein